MQAYCFSCDVSVSGRCVVGFARDGLSEAIAECVTTATYYLGIYPESHVVARVTRQCGACHGRGLVDSKKGFAPKRCPVCRGKDSEVSVAEFPVVIHQDFHSAFQKGAVA